jgi:hypothetical protein
MSKSFRNCLSGIGQRELDFIGIRNFNERNFSLEQNDEDIARCGLFCLAVIGSAAALKSINKFV